MARTAMASVSGNMSDEIKNRAGQLYSNFLKTYDESMDRHHIRRNAFIYGHHHDLVVVLTPDNIVFFASAGSSTDSSSTERYFDFSKKTNVNIETLRHQLNVEFGWQEAWEIRFRSKILGVTEGEQLTEFNAVLEKMANDFLEKRRRINALGIDEAYSYLDNAKKRFDMGGSPGFSDCKANCRNALVSLLKNLTGVESVREAIRILRKERVFGDMEAETIKTIEALVASLYGLSSKAGAHPPMSSEDEALFTLRLTDATMDYLVRKVLVKKGL